MSLYHSSISVQRPPYLGGGNWELNQLTSITVIFGKNGSGKSLILRAIRDTQLETAHYIIPERTGDINFQARLLDGQLSASARRDASARNYMNEYREGIVARVQAYFFARGARRTETIPVPPDRLEKLLNLLLPDFTVVLKGEIPPFSLLRASNGETIDQVNNLSSGEAQILTVALDVITIAAIWELQNAAARVMLIDEPDAHIHPDLQARFADFLVQVAKEFKLQLLIATHSTTLLAAIGQFGKSCASVIYLDRLNHSFRAKPFDKSMKELTACLGGHAMMGPLFGAPLLLVEGDDDYRIWSQVPRHHVVNLSVIPTNGTEIMDYQKSLEQIFGSLRGGGGPAGYALLDHDKPLPAPNSANPQEHVRFIQLRCHESENLYLLRIERQAGGENPKSFFSQS